MIELAAFLGNPGQEYARNRHNAGWLLAEELPFAPALGWRKKHGGQYAVLEGAELENLREREPIAPGEAAPPSRIHFLKPETYMNSSGDSIHAAASFLKIPLDRILLAHDELELPLGTVSLKFSGGLGGHNGLRSMKARFGDAGFWRFRIGIGRPDGRRPGQGGHEGSGRGIIGWVLSDFSAPEEAVLAEVFRAAAGAFTAALLRGPESLLPEWGKKRIAPEPGPQGAGSV